MVIKDLEEFCDIVDGTHLEFELLQHDEHAYKHDTTKNSYLVRHQLSGDYYGLWDYRSYNHGFDMYQYDFPLEIKPIIPEEIKKYRFTMSH